MINRVATVTWWLIRLNIWIIWPTRCTKRFHQRQRVVESRWDSVRTESYLWPLVCFWAVAPPEGCLLLSPPDSRLRSAWPCRRRQRRRCWDRDPTERGRSWTGCCCVLSAARSAPGWWSASGSDWGRSWLSACQGWTLTPCRRAPTDERFPRPRNHRTPVEFRETTFRTLDSLESFLEPVNRGQWALLETVLDYCRHFRGFFFQDASNLELVRGFAIFRNKHDYCVFPLILAAP